MEETRELNQDYIPPFNRNVFFKALNINNIYNFNAIFRQPSTDLFNLLMGAPFNPHRSTIAE